MSKKPRGKIGRAWAMAAKCHQCHIVRNGLTDCQKPQCALYPWMAASHAPPADDPEWSHYKTKAKGLELWDDDEWRQTGETVAPGFFDLDRQEQAELRKQHLADCDIANYDACGQRIVPDNPDAPDFDKKTNKWVASSAASSVDAFLGGFWKRRYKHD